MNQGEVFSYSINQATLRQFWQSQMETERNRNPKRLLRHGFKAYSQNDEDGILQEIFNRIGTDTKRFVEFGVESGLECNTLLMLLKGWSGGWMDANPDHVARIRETHQHLLQSGQLSVLETMVTPENINDKLAELAPDGQLDLLSIDVDYHDYWIWDAVSVIRPRVVTVEYNASWPPPLEITVPHEPGKAWTGSNHFGASLGALAKLGRAKGYLLVGCCFAGVNAFFVRDDLVGDHFHAPGDAAEHYEPARYFMALQSSGHPAGVGPVVTV